MDDLNGYLKDVTNKSAFEISKIYNSAMKYGETGLYINL